MSSDEIPEIFVFSKNYVCVDIIMNSICLDKIGIIELIFD